jgi:hypothetical protein
MVESLSCNIWSIVSATVFIVVQLKTEGPVWAGETNAPPFGKADVETILNFHIENCCVKQCRFFKILHSDTNVDKLSLQLKTQPILF